MLLPAFLAFQFLALGVVADCPTPGPAWPNPGLTGKLPAVKQLAKDLTASVSAAVHAGTLFPSNVTSFSIELTSATDTLWTSHHTAQDIEQPTTVNGDTVFRIASITKMFTVLSVLMQENMNLDDPITKYIPELRKSKAGTIQWNKITLRDLASQASGIFKQYPAGDLAFYLQPTGDPATELWAFPQPKDLPPCGDSTTLCTRKQLLAAILTQTPMFSPGSRPSYSNTAFTLLGFAVAQATRKPWNSVVQNQILTPLRMKHTFLSTPANKTGVIPNMPNDWALQLGDDNPAGGIYSSSSDLSIYARNILNSGALPSNKRLLEPEAVNRWLKPTSFVPSLHNAQGAPWEIIRLQSTELTPDGRPIDLYTKSGGLTGYYSVLTFIPEYDVAVTVLTAGPRESFVALQDLVLPTAVKALETIFRNHAKSLAGTYTAKGGLNSTVQLETDDRAGLKVTKFWSNSTDMSSLIDDTYGAGPGTTMLRASPAGVKKNGGDSWVIQIAAAAPPKGGYIERTFCMGDVGWPIYNGERVLEMVKKEKSWVLPAFDVELFKQ